MGDVVGQRRQREVGRVVVVVGLDRAKVRTVTLGESTRAIQADIIRVMFPYFHHHPRSVPSQGVVAMLTHLYGDSGARVSVAVCCDGDGGARVRRAWADA